MTAFLALNTVQKTPQLFRYFSYLLVVMNTTLLLRRKLLDTHTHEEPFQVRVSEKKNSVNGKKRQNDVCTLTK